MRILVITDKVPYPVVSGGPLRTYSLLERFAREHEVTLAALVETPEEEEGAAHMRRFLHTVQTARLVRRHPLAHLPGLLQFGLSGKPPELKFDYSPELAAMIADLSASVPFDVIQIEHSPMALYLDSVATDLRHRSVLVFHDIVFSKYDRISQLEPRLGRRWRAGLYSRMMRGWEPGYAENFSRCITMSELDRTTLLNANARLRIDVAPNGVDTHRYQPLPPASGTPAMVFVGNMSYLPCIDAMRFFCQEVLPLVRQSVPEVEMWIVGLDPPAEILALSEDGVHVTGRVEDITPYYGRAAVSVVPIRAGGGTRLKILEAMALGRPVVSTTIGAEGLDVTDGEHLLIADEPEAFARQTVRLLKDRELSRRITTSARDLVRQKYDWDAIAQTTLRVFAEASAGGRPATRPLLEEVA